MGAWLCPCTNSIGEILTFQAQWFYPINVRNGNGTVAIGNDRISMHISTHAINLEHLSLIGIVIDSHLLITDHSDTANFAGMKPAHMNMGCHVICKLEVKMSNVMNARLQVSMRLYV